MKQGEIFDFTATYGDTAIVPTCTSTDESVAFVDGTKIFVEGKGTTTINMSINNVSKIYNVTVEDSLDFYVRNNCQDFGSGF